MEGYAGGLERVRAPVTARARFARSRSRAGTLLVREPFVLLILALDAVLLTVHLTSQIGSDTWLGLVGGRQIVHHGLPHHDTLTVWSHGASWVDQQWLGQLFLYAVHAAGGLRAMLLVNAFAFVGAIALALIVARRSGASSRSVALIGIFGTLAALSNTALRTQTLTYVLFVALFWLLSEDLRAPSRRVFLALPLLVIWANVHGSAVLGAALVVLWAVTVVVAARRRVGAGRIRLRAGALAAAAPVCLLASPYALSLPGYYHTVLSNGAFRSVVAEWRPPVFPDQWPFFVLALAAAWISARKAERLTVFDHLALLGMLVAGLDTVRYAVWFAFVAMMVLPRAVDGVWPVSRAPIRPRVNRLLSAAALVTIVAAFGAAAAHSSGWYTRGYSGAAADAVAANAAQDPALRVFANEEYADWLLWTAPALSGRIAFDARFELLTAKQLRAIFHFRNQISADWRASAFGYRLLVLDPRDEKGSVRAVTHESGTRQLYRDDRIAVLLRRPRR